MCVWVLVLIHNITRFAWTVYTLRRGKAWQRIDQQQQSITGQLFVMTFNDIFNWNIGFWVCN